MFNKLLSIFLSINVFISSMGVMAFEHICQKSGTSVSILFKAENCCAKKSSKICRPEFVAHKHDNKGLAFNKKPCCEDKSTFLKITTPVTQASISVLPDVVHDFDFNFEHSLVFNNFNFEIAENQNVRKSYLYKPPILLQTDLRLLYQSFLC